MKNQKSKIKKVLKNKTNYTWLLLIFNFIIWPLWFNQSVAYFDDVLEVRQSVSFNQINAKNTPVGVLEPEKDIRAYVEQECLKRNVSFQEAWAIIQCESNWREYAINKNTNGTLDLGLWQINDIHNISRECRFDYKCATNEALNMRVHNHNFCAWTCAKKLNICKQPSP